eukprot:CAMPEP_0119042432 /NCGR_PEP_ID=MMETSP1177-20130426/15161_1 /TAXON_ID=2985 /ORGANISM="Ochromonas sp, Strain CCMP1899" /LENGTH=68 /DNA_ID=CAMNT_0007009227 /DNA_START=354 /DNA_END=557 /DNA_ORIENTATION=-
MPSVPEEASVIVNLENVLVLMDMKAKDAKDLHALMIAPGTELANLSTIWPIVQYGGISPINISERILW